MSALRKFKALDAFPKIQDDFYSKTMSGGVITVVCSVVMACLFLSELTIFLTRQTVHQLEVDTSRGETFNMKIDITLPRMPCEWVSMTALDVSGHVQLEVDHDLKRQRLTSRGKKIMKEEKHHVGASQEELPGHLHPEAPKLPEGYCGSCYGADIRENQCCNTCEEVRVAYREKGWVMPDYDTVEQCKREGYQDGILSVKNEGCRLWGDVQVAKVQGSMQIAPGKAYEHLGRVLHDMTPLRNTRLDISHTVADLSFGSAYPGQINPLQGQVFDQRKKDKGNPLQQTGVYQYFIKVVPTSYTTLRNQTTQSNQYSVTEHFRPLDEALMAANNLPPSIVLFYDMSAIKVNIVERRTSFLHFVTNVCAIVGGVFTISGVLDASLYHGQKLIRKKMELGKFG